MIKKKLIYFLESLSVRSKQAHPPGHFYSPVIDLNEAKKRMPHVKSLIAQSRVTGVELNEPVQKNWLDIFSEKTSDLEFYDEANGRCYYQCKNDMYGIGDAIILAGFISELKPKRIIEVGSGFSTALMIDVCKKRGLDTQIICIEPFPKRLLSLKMDHEKNLQIKKSAVQDISLGFFQQLEENDILFIDSSHVSKFQSDVNYELFEILPRLKKNVYIHIHDIQYPFEYDESWIQTGYSWNEAYLLRAFLSFNKSFSIQWYSHYMTLFHGPALHQKLPQYLKNGGGSIWLKKEV